MMQMVKVWLGISFLCCSAAWGNDASCYAIQHPDRKNVCLAMSKKQNSYCYAVKDADTKNMCLANVMQQKNYCYAIQEHDMKQQCLSQVKWPSIIQVPEVKHMKLSLVNPRSVRSLWNEGLRFWSRPWFTTPRSWSMTGCGVKPSFLLTCIGSFFPVASDLSWCS